MTPLDEIVKSLTNVDAGEKIRRISTGKSHLKLVATSIVVFSLDTDVEQAVWFIVRVAEFESCDKVAAPVALELTKLITSCGVGVPPLYSELSLAPSLLALVMLTWTEKIRPKSINENTNIKSNGSTRANSTAATPRSPVLLLPFLLRNVNMRRKHQPNFSL